MIRVRAGPARASASTAHDVIEGESTALTRCIAGVARRLRLVARDLHGNATSSPLHRWSVELRSAACDDSFQPRHRARAVAAAHADGSELVGWTGSPALGFTSHIELSDAFSPATAILTYRRRRRI